MSQDAQLLNIIESRPYWEEHIYMLKTTDLALGFDPSNEDANDVANKSGRQLANRIDWLHSLFLQVHQSEGDHEYYHEVHGVDGMHLLTDSDFQPAYLTDNTLPDDRLPEAALALPISTGDLYDALVETDTGQYDRVLALSDTGSLEDLSVSVTAALRKVLGLNSQYSAHHSDLELFTDSYDLTGHFPETALVKPLGATTAAAWDAVDVENYGPFNSGEAYVLYDVDGGRPERIIVDYKVAPAEGNDGDYHRLKLRSPIEHEREEGFVSRTSLSENGDGTATARASAWEYISATGVSHALEDHAGGRLLVNTSVRPAGSNVVTLTYSGYVQGALVTPDPIVLRDGDEDFCELTLDGSYTTTFRIPAGYRNMSFAIRWENTPPVSGFTPYSVNYIGVFPTIKSVTYGLIRQPKLTYAYRDRTAGGTPGPRIRALRAYPYGSIYETPYSAASGASASGKTRVRILSATTVVEPFDDSIIVNDYENATAYVDWLQDPGGEMVLTIPTKMRSLPGRLYVQIQDVDDYGTESDWSEPVEVVNVAYEG